MSKTIPKKLSKSRVGRVAFVNARGENRRLSEPLPRSVLSLSPVPALAGPGEFSKPFRLLPLLDVQDARRWHPEEPTQAPLDVFGRRTQVIPQQKPAQRPYRSKLLNVPHQLAFKNPSRVLVCVRRSVRREVIHAMGKAGKVGQRRPRRNWSSQISCR